MTEPFPEPPERTGPQEGYEPLEPEPQPEPPGVYTHPEFPGTEGQS